jgi:CheY-like chemotaxis protein
MKSFSKLFLDALPEIIAGLAVAGILAIVSILYTSLGVIITVSVSVGIIIIASILIYLISRRNKNKATTNYKDENKIISVDSSKVESANVVRKQTILFVDDDIEVISYGFIVPLEEEGIEVVAATNVAQAINILKSDKPLDMVVSDIMMPYDNTEEGQGRVRYGGLEVIEATKKYRGNIPIICLSVSSNSIITEQVMKLGVYEHLHKPIRPSEFIQRVKLALLLSKQSPSQDMIKDEIKRHRIELNSSSPDTRIRALWALGELSTYDPTLLSLLKDISKTDSEQSVRNAAGEAMKKMRRKIVAKN